MSSISLSRAHILHLFYWSDRVKLRMKLHNDNVTQPANQRKDQKRKMQINPKECVCVYRLSSRFHGIHSFSLALSVSCCFQQRKKLILPTDDIDTSVRIVDEPNVQTKET